MITDLRRDFIRDCEKAQDAGLLVHDRPSQVIRLNMNRFDIDEERVKELVRYLTNTYKNLELHSVSIRNGHPEIEYGWVSDEVEEMNRLLGNAITTTKSNL